MGMPTTSRTASRSGTTSIASTSARTSTYFASWKGQHSFKAGVLYERLRQRREHRRAGIECGLVVERLARGARRPVGPRSLWLLHGAPVGTPLGDISSNNLGLFIQDSWTLSNRLTLNYGVPLGARGNSVLSSRESWLRVQLGDKIGAASWLRVGPKGDSTVEDLRIAGACSLTSSKLEMPRGQLSARTNGSPTTGRSTPSTGPAINCDGTPGSGCPARSSQQVDFRHVLERAGSGPRRARISSRVQGAGAHGRPRSRADEHDVGWRALHAQVAGSHHRGHRHPGARRRRGVSHRQPPARASGAKILGHPVSVTAKARYESPTTAWSSVCASGWPTGGR